MVFRVKKILEDIIDNAYPDVTEDKLKQYKKFYLKITPKELRSKHGHYIYASQTIEIFNLSRHSGPIVKTCIHELAHHIDCCNRKTSDHQAPFYEEYTRLLYAALNMQIIKPEEVSEKAEASDDNKVERIVAKWEPHYINYKQDKRRIIVKNCYNQKEQLKARGYKWSSLENAWVLETTLNSEQEETEYLSSIGCNYFSVVESADLEINAIGHLIACGKTYENKNELKEHGFYFMKKEWQKKMPLQEMEEEKKKLTALFKDKEVTFKQTK